MLFAWVIINLLGITEISFCNSELCTHTVNIVGRSRAFNSFEIRTTNHLDDRDAGRICARNVEVTSPFHMVQIPKKGMNINIEIWRHIIAILQNTRTKFDNYPLSFIKYYIRTNGHKRWSLQAHFYDFQWQNCKIFMEEILFRWTLII
jgi:hypothetical protein